MTEVARGPNLTELGPDDVLVACSKLSAELGHSKRLVTKVHKKAVAAFSIAATWL